MKKMKSQSSRSRTRAFQLRYTAALTMSMAASLAACGAPSDESKPTTSKPALTVAVASPTTQTVTSALTANGTVAAWQEAIIGPEANNLRVEEVLAQVGDRVRKGQSLAKFASDTIANDLRVAEAALREAKAAAIEAQADGERARNLRGAGSLSEQRIQQLLTQEQAARARLESAQAQVTTQKLRLKQTVLRAPDDGIVSARSATIGSVPTQGAEMFRLIRQGRFEWRPEFSAQQLEQIRQGQKVKITSPSGRTWEGLVRLAAPTVDPVTRRGIAYVDITHSDEKDSTSIRPGAYLSGEIAVGDRQGMTVPQSAIVARDGFHLVFIVNDDMRVNQAKVTVGRMLGDQQEILSGLQGKERIVASGGAFLNDGDVVQLANDSAAPSKSGQR
ncbi:MAG: efflux RND transporter periplasmic adaptor subunit [Proteobacteria bacterium]|nr:efflux RND transporter periplasmic adaptor subunit [Pseudomonadota bacterium]